MPKRERTLTDLFPQDCILDRPRISESGRSFSIRKTAGDIVIGIDLRRCDCWPSGKKRADGLFLCLSANSNAFLVVLVELKGSDKERAINQLDDTADALCAKSDFSQQPHSKRILRALASNHSEGHSRKVLGVTIAKTSLSLRQQEKKKARNRGLKIKYRSRKSLMTTVAELRAWFD